MGEGRSSGKALFVANVKNVLEGPLTPKHFISGKKRSLRHPRYSLHGVLGLIKISKISWGASPELKSVGWKYLEAQEDEKMKTSLRRQTMSSSSRSAKLLT